MRGGVAVALAAMLTVAALLAPSSALAAEATDAETLKSAVAAGGRVEVTDTVTLSEPLVVEKDVTLVGGTISLGEGFDRGESLAPITVAQGATLTLEGVTLDGAGVDLGYGSGTGSLIYVAGSLEMTSGSIEHVLNSSGSGNRGIVYLADAATFSMSGGSISDCDLTGGYYQGIVYVAPGATFDLSGSASISGCSVADPQGASGVVAVKNEGATSADTGVGGTLNMSGGSISGNDSCGLYVGSNSGTGEPGKVFLSGGTISDNTYGESYYAGGIYIVNGDVEMSGGTISGNEGHFYGGGVALVANPTARFHMTGGTISDNSSMYGAGVYLTGISTADWQCDVLLEGGRIENNVATRQGGGIYVVRGQEVNIQNAVITENHAEKIGGGIWTCSTGDMRVYVTNGGAVFDNEASGDEGGSAGADLAFVKHDNDEGIQDFSIAMRALGGGRVTYYSDGGVYATNDKGEGLDGSGQYYLGVSDGSVRYDVSNPGEAVTDVNVAGQSYALVSDISEGARAAAESNAKLVITGNRADRGAGVGSNGSVVIGEAPDPGTGVVEYALNVNKVWEGCTDAQKTEVQVALVSDGHQLDTVTLDESNGWSASFEGLPEDDYTVEELSVPFGFKASYSELVQNGTDYSVTVTNAYDPQTVVVKPADLTIYMGGTDGYESVIAGEQGTSDVVTSATNSLPEPGFYVYLPEEANETLEAAGVRTEGEAADLSQYIAVRTADGSKTWTLERYGNTYSGAYDRFVYRIVPAEGQDPLRLEFTDDAGVDYVSDEFDPLSNGALNRHYDMSIYAGDVDLDNVLLDLVVNGKTSTYLVRVEPAKLNVRYVTGSQADVVTGVLNDIADAAEPGVRAYAVHPEGTRFLINGSDIDVTDEAAPSLLFDDVVSSDNTEGADDYRSALESRALDTLGDVVADYESPSFQSRYLDLVDANNGNAWLRATAPTTVYWPYPEDTDSDTEFHLVHFWGLDREMSNDDVAANIAAADAEVVEVENTEYGIRFTTDGFSPFVLVWDEASDTTGGGTGAAVDNERPGTVIDEGSGASVGTLPGTGDPVMAVSGFVVCAVLLAGAGMMVRARRG